MTSPYTQDEFYNIVTKAKNWRQAIKQLQLRGTYKENSIYKRARRLGIKPGIQHAHEIPDDFLIDKSSTLTGKHGELKLQWTKLSRKKEADVKAIRAFAKGLADSVKGKSIYIPPPVEPGLIDLMTNYIEPESHFGMYAWAQETGESYDLKIAEKLLRAGATRLIASAPNSKYALVSGIGDGIHADSTENTTAKGTRQDVDTRWGKVIQKYASFYKWFIEQLLMKHEIVHVKRVKGNHDDHSTVAINLMLSYMFENNPRVYISTEEKIIKYHRFGNVLIGITHGDKSKGDGLPLLMATDQKEHWGETEFRYFQTGHIHHLSRKEHPGCIVESFRSIASKDAWHAGQGYRAGREMVMILMDIKFGEIERHVIGVNQLT